MRSEVLRTFTSRLREARINAGLTQEQLGQRLGLGAGTCMSYVCRLERGTREPRLETLVRVADALGVSIDYLTGRDRDEDPCRDPSRTESP